MIGFTVHGNIATMPYRCISTALNRKYFCEYGSAAVATRDISPPFRPNMTLKMNFNSESPYV